MTALARACSLATTSTGRGDATRFQCSTLLRASAWPQRAPVPWHTRLVSLPEVCDAHFRSQSDQRQLLRRHCVYNAPRSPPTIHRPPDRDTVTIRSAIHPGGAVVSTLARSACPAA